MILEAQVGPRVVSDGSENALRTGRTGSLIVNDVGHGRYYEAVSRGRVFLAANQAATALSLLNATATGLILTNPAGSGLNLSILDISIAIATAPAGVATLALAANVNPVAAAVVHTTPLIVRNALLGATPASGAFADGAATLPATPVVIRGIGGGPAATGSVTTAYIRDEIAGEIVVAPGAAVSLTALTTAISVVASIVWEELVI